MGRLLFIFILIPTIELFLLVEIGKRIGTLNTLLLIVVTGVVGAWLVRLQGLQVLSKIRRETSEGTVPAGALVDGLIILIAGAVLMTPGVLTDIFGFLCLVPAFRNALKQQVKSRLESAAQSGRPGLTVDFGGFSAPTRPPKIKDITPED